MFPFLRTKIFFLIILGAIVATFYYFGDPQKLVNTVLPKLKETPLAPVVEKIEQIQAENITVDFQQSVQNAENEISGLSQKTLEIGKHAENVLGSSVTAVTEENQTPIHEKAFEYGKYIYCKQVVDDYEKLNPSLTEN
jgi:hypothetical protein